MSIFNYVCMYVCMYVGVETGFVQGDEHDVSRTSHPRGHQVVPTTNRRLGPPTLTYIHTYIHTYVQPIQP